jgi:hypothetical protein
VGTENNKATDNHLPVGSALRTDAGDFKNHSFVQSIIHAAPEDFNSFPVGPNREKNFFDVVALAVKNSLILANREGDDYQIAIPFIGSAIFGGGTADPANRNLITGGSNRADLAKIVVNSAINQSEDKAQLCFIV